MAINAKRQNLNVVSLPSRKNTEKEIVEGILNNEPQYAAKIYDVYGKKINNLVWKLLGADSEHDDIVNTVFVNIFSSIEKLKNPNALKDWITGITINTVRREIRSRRYRRLFLLVDEIPNHTVININNDEQIIMTRMFSILKKMNLIHHIVFVLRYVEEYTLGEIATACNFSLATAKRKVNKSKIEFLKRAKTDSIFSSFIKEIDYVS